MFYIRFLENWMVAGVSGKKLVDIYNQDVEPNVGPGFLNVWKYYEEPY